ncbi:MAG: diguanylate cyclase, partial [Holophaga sp.]|nr:diguanylate cyclase [Holophaga sp.]
FKLINDTLGHTLGDQVLQSVAHRLQACLRASDTLSRQGGDEFVVLLPEVEGVDDAALIARKFLAVMARPHMIGGRPVPVTISIGISRFPDDGPDLEAIVRHADAAMYRAKALGRNNRQVFKPDMAHPDDVPAPEPPRGGRCRPEGSANARARHAGSRRRALRPGALPRRLARMDRRLAFQVRSAPVARAIGTTRAQLQEANECLVIAAIKAQTMAEEADRATAEIARLSKVERQLQEVQKQESLGVLAGGVAHDFNNLLTAIMGNASMGATAVEEHGNAAPYFAVIEKTALRAADLTRQLLAYVGKGHQDLAEVDLGLVVKEISLLLQASIPGTVTLDFDLAGRLPFVKGDATQIFQVLLNLITNASESFEGAPGHIAVRTRSEALPEAPEASREWVLPVAPGRFATLEVADSGAGMAPEVLARIFEPFYSTKFTGRGLGLAAVIGIIRSHGGGLTVRSRPGHGSTFKVYLPAMVEARTAPDLEPRIQERGTGAILMVDEDPEALRRVRTLAEDLGFSVLEAGGGREAIDLFRQHHRDLVLVLMGLAMPSLGGKQAFRAMRAIDRDVPVVLGGHFEVPDRAMAVKGLAGLLRQPYRAAEFTSMLHRTLAKDVWSV